MRAVKIFLSKKQTFVTPPGLGKHLSTAEITQAEVALARIAQKEVFPKEFESLQQHGISSDKSRLQSLHPFFYEQQQIIRVGGRLRRSPESAEFKHQIVLPDDHHITTLVSRYLHEKQAHCGQEHLISSLRQRFWPLKCRCMVKKVINNCMACRKRSVKPTIPLMADLPVQRITGFSKPFQFTGLDYFGPLIAKRARSRVKRWGCIFTCMVTRAVHLELSDSLDTSDFIMTLRCFIGRRGAPAELFSDNGSNFRGADRELRDNLRCLDQDKIIDFSLQNCMTWNFIPPHAPHFGGAWESLVKSVKRSLSAILKEQIVTDTVLRTTLVEVEAIMNSRPLTYNSTDANDFSALTPNHFLYGGATAVTSIGKFDDQDFSSRRRWRHCQVLSDHKMAERIPSKSYTAKSMEIWAEESQAEWFGALGWWECTSRSMASRTHYRNIPKSRSKSSISQSENSIRRIPQACV